MAVGSLCENETCGLSQPRSKFSHVDSCLCHICIWGFRPLGPNRFQVGHRSKADAKDGGPIIIKWTPKYINMGVGGPIIFHGGPKLYDT